MASYACVLGELDYGPGLTDVRYLDAGNFSVRRAALLRPGGYNPAMLRETP